MGDKDSETTDAKTWSSQAATKFEKLALLLNSKAYSEYFDPCQEAANKSIRCLNRNGGDRQMCTDFFQAYRDCKEQWMNARKEARKGKSWFS
ncbi:cytochrome c oxidase-assembly factor COX23, mitochondrial [Dendryphion nanum]|uniref:Cytochrome c oxidase-assembly factor COX23, mitochondrial n=1 Tax=Dendryphion nanum TaxID=256645 RepID=A0A9P9IR59_9PLEO|nr:cytochrome c oxidase-assembly factor COX23, mitochondrial [Dendryphion nanum]